MKVENGDIIRGYDFKPMVGRDDCFIEGEVLDRNNNEMGYQAYKVRVTRDSWAEGDDKGRVGKEFFIPWRVSFSEYQGRVINLSR